MLTKRKYFHEERFIAVIVAVGLCLRVWHIGWGLPEIFEEATPFTIAWQFWHWGSPGLDFNPHFFNYPALTFYINFFNQALQYGIGHLAGSYADLPAFHKTFMADPSVFIIVSRLVSVLFDGGTIVLVYLLASLWMNKNFALFPALLAAINPLMIRNSHLINVDTPLTFFSLLTLYFILQIHKTGESKWYILAGLSIGLAASSKYNGALLLPVLAAGHILRFPKPLQSIQLPEIARPLKAAALAAGVFILLNPFMILSFDEFYRDFSFEESHMAAGHLGIDQAQTTMGFYLSNTLPGALGWFFLLFIPLSAVSLLLRKNKEHLLLFLFPLLYIGVIMTWKMRADRYILPAIPMLILIGTLGLSELNKLIIESTGKFAAFLKSGHTRAVLQSIVCLLFIVEPLSADRAYQSSLSLPDTRVVAKEWILRNVPRGGVIVTPPFGLTLPDSIFNIFPMPFLSVNPERVAPFYDTRWFDDFDLIIASDYDYGRYLKDTSRYHDFISYYSSLRSRFVLAYEVKPIDQQPGPTFWLYRPSGSTSATFTPELLQRLTNMPESIWVSRFLKNLGILSMAKQKFEKTEQISREILSVEPLNFEVLRMLLDALEILGRNEDGLARLDTLVRIHPAEGKLLAWKGNILLKLEREEEAEFTLKKSLDLHPPLEMVYDDLLRIYIRRKDKRNAIDILTRHHKIVPPGSEKARLIERDLQTLQSMPG